MQRLPVELAWQMIEESREIVLVEFLERRELPEHGTKLIAELGKPGSEEALDEGAGLGEHLLLCHEARALYREFEAVRRGGRPFAEARRGLQAVVGGVDLDRGQPARGVGKLIGLLQSLGIEGAAPRRIDPAPDPDADLA